MTPVAHPTKKSPTPICDPRAGSPWLTLMHHSPFISTSQPELRCVLEPSLSRTQIRDPLWLAWVFLPGSPPLSIPRAPHRTQVESEGGAAPQKAGVSASGLVSVSSLGLP